MNSKHSGFQEHHVIENQDSQTDANLIDITSTSSVTSNVSPIVIKKSGTDKTRVLFVPKLIDNQKDNKKSISGKLVYEKKDKDGTYPSEKITPRNVKSGETIEISLDSTAVLSLFQNLKSLYEVYEQYGIQYGTTSYQRVDNDTGIILNALKKNPSLAKMLSNPEYHEFVKSLLQAITETDSIESLTDTLNFLRNRNITQLSEAVNIERLKRVISLFEENLDNNKEEFWHTVFRENQWILAQLFASPCTIFEDKAYVGGKGVDNRNGNVCDFLYQNNISNNVVLIEIKTPQTKIINSSYRNNTSSFTYEMSGAVNQVINYKDSLLKNFYDLCNNTHRGFSVFNPKCVVVIGMLKYLEKEQIATFENFRNSLNSIQIITYDEILQRLKGLRDVFSGEKGIDQKKELPF